jgi:hypothetical protein
MVLKNTANFIIMLVINGVLCMYIKYQFLEIDKKKVDTSITRFYNQLRIEHSVTFINHDA